MPFATPRTAGFVLIATIALPTIVAPGILAVANDQNRWSKPDIYLILAAGFYSLAVSAIYMLSPGFRNFISTRLTGWQSVLLNPVVVLYVSFNWVRHHDPVFPIVMWALIAWLSLRRKKATQQRAP